MYSCAAAAQTFLCAFASAFLQSREQYCTLLHVMHGRKLGFSGSASGVAHLAQAAGGWLSDAIDGCCWKDIVLCTLCIYHDLGTRDFRLAKLFCSFCFDPRAKRGRQGIKAFLQGYNIDNCHKMRVVD